MKAYKTLIAAVALCGVASAQDVPGSIDAGWKYSLLAVGAANAADTATSWGRYELNPVLGNGRFGMRQAAIKGTVGAGAAIAETLIVRKWPRSSHVLKYLNFADAAATGAVAAENWRTR